MEETQPVVMAKMELETAEHHDYIHLLHCGTKAIRCQADIFLQYSPKIKTLLIELLMIKSSRQFRVNMILNTLKLQH